MDYFDTHSISKEQVNILLGYQTELMQLCSSNADESIKKNPKVEEFLQMWDVTEFTGPFNYVEWSEQVGLNLENQDEVIKFVKSANKDDVRRIGTAVVRMEKFNDGYLDDLWKKGFAQLFFDKLKEYE